MLLDFSCILFYYCSSSHTRRGEEEKTLRNAPPLPMCRKQLIDTIIKLLSWSPQSARKFPWFFISERVLARHLINYENSSKLAQLLAKLAACGQERSFCKQKLCNSDVHWAFRIPWETTPILIHCFCCLVSHRYHHASSRGALCIDVKKANVDEFVFNV